jgi:hypothetical protein
LNTSLLLAAAVAVRILPAAEELVDCFLARCK